MKRLVNSGRIVIALLIVATVSSSASADWRHFWHHFHITWHRNNAWPQPFNEADSIAVMRPFEIMKQNGWRVHNTIGHELFREGDGALLAAGHNRLEWIATQAPTARRQVYVLRGRNADETRARVESVQDALTNIQVSGPETQVFVTEIEPATAPGAWATKIARDAMDNMPAPILPNTSSSGQTGATQASGGGGGGGGDQ